MNDISPKEHYQNLNGYKPRYANPVPKRDYGVVWFSLLVVALIMLWLFMAFHPIKTSVAHAEESSRLSPSLLNSKEALCTYLELYPEKIKNLKEAKRDCL